MPRGFETEDGHRPDFAAEYNAVELAGGGRERTQAVARKSDATVWFGDTTSPGGKATLRAYNALGRPVFVMAEGTRPSELTT